MCTKLQASEQELLLGIYSCYLPKKCMNSSPNMNYNIGVFVFTNFLWSRNARKRSTTWSDSFPDIVLPNFMKVIFHNKKNNFGWFINIKFYQHNSPSKYITSILWDCGYYFLQGDISWRNLTFLTEISVIREVKDWAYFIKFLKYEQ